MLNPTDSDQAIIQYLQANPGARTVEVAKAAPGRSLKSCRVFLGWLVKAGQAEFTKEKNAFCWRLK